MKRLLCLLVLIALPAQAQLVAGPWVDRAEARIREHRMAEVEVLVLDGQDRPVSGAEVRVTQRKHAFPFGVVLPLGSPELLSRVGDPDRSLWRGLSAVSLAEFSAWPVLQPGTPTTQRTLDPAGGRQLDELLTQAQARGLRVRLAAAAPGDAADRPAWAVGLGPEERSAATLRFFQALVELAAGRAQAVDLVSSGASHPWLLPAAVRRLGQAGRVASAPAAAGGTRPPLRLGLGGHGALLLDRGGAVLPELDALRRAFVPVDGITTSLRLTRAAPPQDLERALQRLATFDLDAAVSPLTVAVDPVDQPFELETALILLFAEPRVQEIQFGGVEPGGLDSLFDAAGNPTQGGAGVDFLIADRWWSREKATTDALGIARIRVFAGEHSVEAGGEEVVFAVAAGNEPVRVVVGTGPPAP